MRLAGLSDDERLVLHTAAVLGRHFDWRLLPSATGLSPGLVSGALERGSAGCFSPSTVTRSGSGTR